MTTGLRSPALLAAVCSAALAPAARGLAAEGWGFQGSATFLHKDYSLSFLERNPSATVDAWQFYSRTVLDLFRGRFSGGFQIDANTFESSPHSTRVHKWYFEYAHSAVSAIAGDFYASFGRGTSLSVVRTHEGYGLEYQVDDTIQGGRLRYAGGRASVEALAGAFHDIDGRGDRLQAVDGIITVARELRAGGSLVRYDDPGGAGGGELGGLRMEAPRIAGVADVYAEFSAASSELPFVSGASGGQAAYVEVAAQWRSLSVTGEYERLHNFFFPYATPPILEDQREELLADFFSTWREDLEGTRVRLDLPVKGTLVSVAYAQFDEGATHRPSYPRYRRDIRQVYGGIERSLGAGVYVQASIGRRIEDSTGYYLQFSGPATSGWVHLTAPLTGGFSAEVEYRAARFHGQFVEFSRNKLMVTLAQSQRWSLTGLWESSNLPSELFHGGKEDFYSVQGELKILGKHLVRVLGGETRGGTKCSGGVCRYIPAFGGVRVEGVIRFP